jgi:hypothetical protein
MPQLQPRQDNCKAHLISHANFKYPNWCFPKYFLTINCNHRFLAKRTIVLTSSTSTPTYTCTYEAQWFDNLTPLVISLSRYFEISQNVCYKTFSTYPVRKGCAQILFTGCIVILLRKAVVRCKATSACTGIIWWRWKIWEERLKSAQINRSKRELK